MSPPTQSQRAARIVEIEARRARNPDDYREHLNCITCGSSLAGRRIDVKFCDARCQKIHNERERRRLANPGVTKPCAVCKQPFTTRKSRHETCGAECKKELRRRKQQQHNPIVPSPTLEQLIWVGTDSDAAVARLVGVPWARVASWRKRFGIQEGFK